MTRHLLSGLVIALLALVTVESLLTAERPGRVVRGVPVEPVAANDASAALPGDGRPPTESATPRGERASMLVVTGVVFATGVVVAAGVGWLEIRRRRRQTVSRGR